MLLAALGVLTRIVTPLQTVVNARLRGTLGTPFRASLVSFTVGLAATTIAALLLGPYPLVPESALHGPWWMWFAGLFGVIFMTGNILLLPRSVRSHLLQPWHHRIRNVPVSRISYNVPSVVTV